MSRPTIAPTTPTALEVAEQQLAAKRAECDQLKAQLDAMRAERGAAALTLPYPPMARDYEETVIRVLNGRLSLLQAKKLRALHTGLTKCNARLADGKPVYLPFHAVEWLLESLEFTP